MFLNASSHSQTRLKPPSSMSTTRLPPTGLWRSRRPYAVEVFAPETALGNWSDVLRHWVLGLALGDLSGSRFDVAQFIEADLIYRLVWGMEAARVYEAAQGNPVAETLSGTAVTAIETGTLNRSASVLFAPALTIASQP